ncbi:restriction endonuclease subunit S [bacterium]|nr:MAG: restriction endonuclease subunit S [bacterium]
MSNMAIKKRVPKLRFPEFDGEWEEKRLGDVYEMISTNSLSRDQLNYESGAFRNIHYGDIHTKFQSLFNVNTEEVPFINEDVSFDIKNDNQLLSEGDLVFADASEDYSDIGKSIEVINTNNSKIVAGLHTIHAKLKQSSKVKVGFTANALKSWKFRKQVMTIAQGTKVLSISPTRLKKLILNYPSINEQQKIAAFLSAVDKKIELLTKKKELLEQYKKGVMQQIFTQKIRFKDQNGNTFPAWQTKRLGDVATFKKDKNLNLFHNNVLTNSAVDGIVNQAEYFDREIVTEANLDSYYIVEMNDFVYNPRISSSAPVGPIKRNKLVTGVMSPLYNVFRFKTTNLDFIEYYFETSGWHEHLKKVANYGARHDRMNITNADFMKMPIPQPCEAEQKQIVSFLNQINVKYDSTSLILNKSHSFKKSLIQQMLI